MGYGEGVVMNMSSRKEITVLRLCVRPNATNMRKITGLADFWIICVVTFHLAYTK